MSRPGRPDGERRDATHEGARVTAARAPAGPGPAVAARLKAALAFAGPGYLVAVGYMDPGNWATALEGGSRFGYALLSVVVASSIVAMFFQAAALRLGLASGRDLAQACRDAFPPAVNLLLWALCEVAIVACNLAEVLGMAIGLNLLFGIPLLFGVLLTVADVLVILGLQRHGFRLLDAVVVALITLVAVCFALQIFWLQPPFAAVLAGLLPPPQLLSHPDMLYVAVGIVGATVMPHNLYLHSSIVQRNGRVASGRPLDEAIRWATLDSTFALAVAMLVNGAILIVAAGAFHRGGVAVTDLTDAYKLLSPALGAGLASVAFGIALVASGLSSSVTGTLAGQVVMLGFLGLRWGPGWRALATRLLAIGPAVAAIALYGDSGVGRLLVLSQVVLSLQLPFAIVPLLMFTTRRRHLGDAAFGWPVSTLLWGFASMICALNVWMLHRQWSVA